MLKAEIPLVSVHCLTYGRPWRLEEAIESFLRQDYPNKEMVILNDLPEQELVYNHDYPNVRIVNLEARCPTLGDARNTLIAEQHGEIIVQLDDDDIILPNYISNCVRLLGDKDWIMPTKGVMLYKYNMKMVECGGAHFTFRKDAWKKVKGFSSMNSGEDWDFYHKLERETKGEYVHIYKRDIGYIGSWSDGTYHVSILNLSESGTQIERDLILRDIELKRLPSGRIQLFPNWKHDYIELFNNFLK